MTKKKDTQEINEVAAQIGQLLKEHGLGMQAVIQIFKEEKKEKSPPKSNIILPGSEQDIPPEVIEALKPIGDKIG